MIAAMVTGTVLGFLSGLGTGGGSLLILYLTLCLGWDNETARLVNLMFFVPAAIIACFFRCRQGKLSFKKVLPGIIAASISSLIFSILSPVIDQQWIKRMFGILLLFTGFRELTYREQ